MKFFTKIIIKTIGVILSALLISTSLIIYTSNTEYKNSILPIILFVIGIMIFILLMNKDETFVL